MTATATAGAALAHPRIRARRAVVADQKVKARNRRIIAAGAVVLAVLLAAASTQSPLLDVDEVRVIGVSRQDPEFIREVAALGLGEPLLGLELGAAEQRLAELPGVARVELDKSWGGLVTISVVERSPAARVQTGELTMLIADDGVVIDVVTTPIEGLPLIRGAMFDALLGESVPAELGEALAVATVLPDDIGQTVEAIEVSVDELGLGLGGESRVELGDARELDAKFEAIRAVLGQVDLRCLDHLNVSAPTVPVIARKAGC